jgi:hypothetical protein
MPEGRRLANDWRSCINEQLSFLPGVTMPNQYRQNYTPSRPLPRWLKRIINWL